MSARGIRSTVVTRVVLLAIGIPALVFGTWGAGAAWAMVLGGPPDVAPWDPRSRPDGIRGEDVVGAALLTLVATLGAAAIAVVVVDVARQGRPAKRRRPELPPAEKLRPIALLYATSQFVPAALLLAFLVGSLLLSGAQVGAVGSALWAPIVPFPLFVVPDAVLISLAAVGLVCAVAWAATSRPNESRQFAGALGPTAAAAISALFFWFAYAGDRLGGNSPIAAGLSAASAALMVVTSLLLARRSRSGAERTAAMIPTTRSTHDTVVEAAREAVLDAVPRLRAEYSSLVGRGEARPQRWTRRKWGETDVIAIVGLLVGLLVAGLVLPSPRTGRPALGVEDAASWVGLAAATALVVFVVLEPGRRDSFFLGAHTRTAGKVYAFLVVVWIVVLAFMLASGDRQSRDDADEITGFVLLGVSIVGMAALTAVAVRRDRAALVDPAVAAKDEWGVTADGDPGADPIERWWEKLPRRLTAAERRAAVRSYGPAIDELARIGVIRARDARRLRRKRPLVVWRGDAG